MPSNVDRLRRAFRLYHFTDAKNIPSIRKLGGLWSTAKLRETGAQFHPGGNEHSLEADQSFGMDRYVHLCFTMKHPMAHICTREGRIEKLWSIYIEDTSAVFRIDGIKYCEEVANKSGAQIQPIEYARENFDDVALYDYLDWEVGDNYAGRRSVEKCEILVPDHLPLKYFMKSLPNS